MMEAVLPLKISGDWQEYDLQRAAMLVFSLNCFYRGPDRLTIHVIVRPDDMPVIKSAIPIYANIAINVVDENEVVPALRLFPKAAGWYKQQCIKLASHKLVSKTEFLALDADLFCCRAFDKDSFHANGKAYADWEPRKVHADWWEASARILGVSPDLEEMGIKPTPAILNVSICKQLAEKLEAKYGNCWAHLLSHEGWTEFTLYNLFCDSISATGDLYNDNAAMGKMHAGLRSADSFSNEETFLTSWSPERSLITDPKGYFMVLNSSTHINPTRIWSRLAPHFSSTPGLFELEWPKQATDEVVEARVKSAKPPLTKSFYGCSYTEGQHCHTADSEFHRGIVQNVIEVIRPQPGPTPLIRIGGNADGAYLVPMDLDGVDACFSPGVNNKKLFEDQLSKERQIKVFMCDYSSDSSLFGTPLIEGVQFFRKLWLDSRESVDSISLTDWTALDAPGCSDLILQMDIEGAEYRNILDTSAEVIDKFRIIVIELHGLNNILNKDIFYTIFLPFFERMTKGHSCVHVHPNNYSKPFQIPGSDFNLAEVTEFTFLRNDRFKAELRAHYAPLIPHPLDILNAPNREPIVLSECWLPEGERPLPSMLKILADEVAFLRNSASVANREFSDALETVARFASVAQNCGHSTSDDAVDSSLVEVAGGCSYSLSSAYGGFKKNGAVPLTINSKYFFHTQIGYNQSISIDLGKEVNICRVLISNRLDACGDRARLLLFILSLDEGYEHATAFRLDCSQEFLRSQAPLSVNIPTTLARFCKILSPVYTALHFSSIKIFAQLRMV